MIYSMKEFISLKVQAFLRILNFASFEFQVDHET